MIQTHINSIFLEYIDLEGFLNLLNNFFLFFAKGVGILCLLFLKNYILTPGVCMQVWVHKIVTLSLTRWRKRTSIDSS